MLFRFLRVGSRLTDLWGFGLRGLGLEFAVDCLLFLGLWLSGAWF